MELKLHTGRRTRENEVSSNRTFMELKHKYNEVEKYKQMGSNRTFMELKLTMVWLFLFLISAF